MTTTSMEDISQSKSAKFLLFLLYGTVGFAIYCLTYDLIMLYYYMASIIVVAVAVTSTKWLFGTGGLLFSKHCLQHVGDPLKKKTTLKKWCDQSWQLVVHVTMSLCEWEILKHETWWQDTDTLWVVNHDTGLCIASEYPFKIKFFFIFQLAIWTYTAFSCKYLEEVRKDYLVMMAHHVITIILICVCYLTGYLNGGLLIMYLHDVSDIPLDILKMLNYVKLGSWDGFFLTEIAFVVLLIDWIYFRIYLYPTKILATCIFHCRTLCYPLVEDFWFPKGLPFYIPINSLLVFLWLLHLWWGFLILRLLVGILTKGTHQAAEDEYEGHSSDSDNEIKKPAKQRKKNE